MTPTSQVNHRAEPSAPSTDYADFLREHVLTQPHSVMRYDVDGETLWLKRAGPSHAAWRYSLLGLGTRVLGMPALQPVPNPGGRASIATEVRRLNDLTGRGLRVPAVLAHCSDGLLLRHLGAPGQDTPSLGNEMEDLAQHRGSAAPAQLMALWEQGLHAIRRVHRAGTCLSQAFARNLVRCPDGMIGYIDFEDDPAATLPLPLCHARDALCYAHSTAWILQKAGLLPDARAHWKDWVLTLPPEAHSALQTTVARLAWSEHLPRSWGRDAERVRRAYGLMRQG